MKKIISLIAVLSIAISSYSQILKPYILGATSNGTIDETKIQVKSGLERAGFTVVGEYMPVEDASRWVMIISHPALDNAVKTVGGLTGFASTLRLAVTKEESIVNISYTNPPYWGNAYFRDDFDKVTSEYTKVESAFKQAVANIGEAKGTAFGSEKGEEIDFMGRKSPYFFVDQYNEEFNRVIQPMKGGYTDNYYMPTLMHC